VTNGFSITYDILHVVYQWLTRLAFMAAL